MAARMGMRRTASGAGSGLPKDLLAKLMALLEKEGAGTAGKAAKGGLLAKLFGGIGSKAVGGGLAALLVLPLLNELLDTFTPIGPEGRARTAASKLQRNQLLANALLLGEEKSEGRRNRQLVSDERALDRSARRDEMANQQDLARLVTAKGGLRDAAELTSIIQQVAGMAGQLPAIPGPDGDGQVLQQMGF